MVMLHGFMLALCAAQDLDCRRMSAVHWGMLSL